MADKQVTQALDNLLGGKTSEAELKQFLDEAVKNPAVANTLKSLGVDPNNITPESAHAALNTPELSKAAEKVPGKAKQKIKEVKKKKPGKK
jgi:hypothetical protein